MATPLRRASLSRLGPNQGRQHPGLLELGMNSVRGGEKRGPGGRVDVVGLDDGQQHVRLFEVGLHRSNRREDALQHGGVERFAPCHGFEDAASLVIRSARRHGFDARVSRAVAVSAAASIALAAVWKILHAVPGVRWIFSAGVGVGLVLLATR